MDIQREVDAIIASLTDGGEPLPPQMAIATRGAANCAVFAGTFYRVLRLQNVTPSTARAMCCVYLDRLMQRANVE